jgi:hypothetical protein
MGSCPNPIANRRTSYLRRNFLAIARAIIGLERVDTAKRKLNSQAECAAQPSRYEPTVCEIQLRNLYLSGAIFSVFLSVSPLFSVFLKTKVPNGICLSPRLSRNLSQALRTDKIWPGRRSLYFSPSRLEIEPRDPTGLSLHNRARKTYLLFITLDLYIKYFEQSLYLF